MTGTGEWSATVMKCSSMAGSCIRHTAVVFTNMFGKNQWSKILPLLTSCSIIYQESSCTFSTNKSLSVRVGL